MTPTRPVGKSAPCKREAGVLQAAEQQRHEHDRQRVVTGKRSDDDARVAVVRRAEAARIELVAKVAVLARAAETGDRAREAHDRHDLATRAHSRIPAGTRRVADHLNLEAEPRTRVEHPDDNGHYDRRARSRAAGRAPCTSSSSTRSPRPGASCPAERRSPRSRTCHAGRSGCRRSGTRAPERRRS